MLSINTGDEVVFEMHKNQVILKKKTATDRNFEKYVGYLSHLKGKTPEENIKQLRGNLMIHSVDTNILLDILIPNAAHVQSSLRCL